MALLVLLLPERRLGGVGTANKLGKRRIDLGSARTSNSPPFAKRDNVLQDAVDQQNAVGDAVGQQDAMARPVGQQDA